MSDYINDIIDAVIDKAETLDLYADIVRGPLPPDNGISVYPATGTPQTTFINKRHVYNIGLTLNGKHASQQTVSSTLNGIHTALTTTKNLPATDYWQICDIATIALPTYLDREENNQYLYGSSLMVRAYIWSFDDPPAPTPTPPADNAEEPDDTDDTEETNDENEE